MSNYLEQRLDRYIRSKYGKIPQSLIEKAIRHKDILVNGKKVKSYTRVTPNDEIYIHPNIEQRFVRLISSATPNTKAVVTKKHQVNFKQSIIYEDDDLLIINKPAGVAVQLGTKTNIALDVIARMYNSETRLVHRIDKNTSGITVFAKNAEVARYMLDMFKTRQVKKVYVALLSKKISQKNGVIRERLSKSKDRVIIDPINGKLAITKFELIENIGNKSLIYVHPLTGRTHQIRVHMASIGVPIFGDKKYGGTPSKYLHLHAYKISFRKYNSHKILSITAPPPDYLHYNP